MPSKRFHNLSADKQARILGAAAEEFAASGFEGASYNRIIERAGVSKGAMYYYFDDKADLYGTVVGHAVQAMMVGMGDYAEVDSAEAFWARMADDFRTMTRMAAHDAQMLGIFRALMRDAMSGVGAEIMAGLRVELGGWTDVLLAAGQRVGAVRTDLPQELLGALAMGVGEAHDLWLMEHIETLSEAELDGVADDLVDLYQRLLRP